MGQFGVILALIFSLIIAIFAIANNQLIVVNYLYGKAEMSAIVVILGAAILGALVMFLINLFRQVSMSLQIRGLRNDIKDCEGKYHALEGERNGLKIQLDQLQEALELSKKNMALFPGAPPRAREEAAAVVMEQEQSKEMIKRINEDDGDRKEADHTTATANNNLVVKGNLVEHEEEPPEGKHI